MAMTSEGVLLFSKSTLQYEAVARCRYGKFGASM